MTRDSVAGDALQAKLDAWRAQGLDRRDPVRFAFLAALARRAAASTGRTRTVLEAKLARAVRGYEGAVTAAAPQPQGAASRQGDAGGPGALTALVERLAGRRQAEPRADAAGGQPPMLEDVRSLVARQRIERQARAALARAPGNAGPLNSALLAHRALALMHAQSPSYLRHFLDYLDTLAWLEAPADATRPRPARKS